MKTLFLFFTVLSCPAWASTQDTSKYQEIFEYTMETSYEEEDDTYRLNNVELRHSKFIFSNRWVIWEDDEGSSHYVVTTNYVNDDQRVFNTVGLDGSSLIFINDLKLKRLHVVFYSKGNQKYALIFSNK